MGGRNLSLLYSLITKNLLYQDINKSQLPPKIQIHCIVYTDISIIITKSQKKSFLNRENVIL